MTSLSQNRNVLYGFLFCAFFALFLYLNTLPNPFLYDDVYYIEKNPVIRSVSPSDAFLSPFSPFAPGLYRPATTLSFALDHTVFGLRPSGFHFGNALMHGLASGALFLLLFQLSAAFIPSLLGGLLFAAHPVHTEAVAWVSGRSEILAGLFTFLSALAFLKYRQASAPKEKRVLLSILTIGYFLALSSKEIAAPLPLFLLLIEILYPVEQKSRKQFAIPYIAFVGALLLYLLFRVSALGALSVPLEQTRTAGLSFLSRMLLMIPVIAHYIILQLYPVGLRIEYDWTAFSFITTVGALLLIVSVVLCGVLLKKKKKAIGALGILWFFLFLLPVANIIPIGELLAERFLYLPSAGLSLLVVSLLVHTTRERRRKMVVGLLTIISFFSLMTLSRNADWRDQETFWRSTLALSPNAPHAMQNLSALLLAKGEVAEAEEILSRGIEKWPEKASLLHLAGQAAMQRGDAARAHELFEGALVKAGPHDLDMTDFQRGSILLQLERLEEALPLLEKSAEQNPYDAAVQNNLGIVHAQLGDAEKALEHFRRSIELYETKWRRSREDQRNYEGVQQNIEALEAAL